MQKDTTKKQIPYFIMAVLTVIVWGTTFVSTKILLDWKLTPVDIFFYRFLLAYAAIWIFCPKRFWADTVKDEVFFFCAGLTGGSLYFIAENTALDITLASNVSLIVSIAPLVTAFLSHLFVKGEKLRSTLIYGSLLALTGVAFVVYNGNFILKIKPTGDILALTSAVMWGLYTVILKRLDTRYPILFITRKVFFYGIVTILPVFCISPLTTDTAILFRPAVWGNLLFLGFIASMLCYILWNVAVKHLGAIRTTNYIYFMPIVTLITSALVIHEPITPIALSGAALILGGVYLAESKRNQPSDF
ncbi:MAG: DMT family transporter [Tannerellaceae bacterium]|jgi:drug/metabolite transporter (DMT)-like permease|nr:DMT family transporter [Tannerellaceae bacterium]